MSVGLFLLRIVVGSLLIGHGTQKLFGWFGGKGLEGTKRFFQALGYPSHVLFPILAGAREALGGFLIAVGFLTPPSRRLR